MGLRSPESDRFKEEISREQREKRYNIKEKFFGLHEKEVPEVFTEVDDKGQKGADMAGEVKEDRLFSGWNPKPRFEHFQMS